MVLTGEGRGFCAGQEVGADFMPGPDGPPDLQALADRFHHEVVRRIRGSRLPFVCAVNGVAAGAGASFALACDIVLAARSATFVQAFIRIGLVPDSGASFFLTHLVGEARARALAMLGDAIDAETAERWGMIWKAVDDAALASEAEALAVRLARLSGRRAGRDQARCSARRPHHWTHSSTWRPGCRAKPAGRRIFAEGVRAFQEKRPPRF